MVRGVSAVSQDEVTVPDGRDTRWADHRAERHERILQAAVTCIAEHGGSVGVGAIATEAGVPRSVVYRLFENRDDLDEQIRARIVDKLMSELAPALRPTGTYPAAIRLAVRTYVTWVAKYPRLHQFLGTGSATRPTTGPPATVTATRTAIAEEAARLIEREFRRSSGTKLPKGLADNTAFAMIGLVDGAVNRWVARPNSRSSSKALVDFLCDALWGVLVTTAASVGLTLAPDQPIAPARTRDTL